MADLIVIKGGSGDVPALQDREIAYRKDEKALYIGTEDGNVRLCGEEDVARITNLDTTISSLNAMIERMSKDIQDIIVRLDALEKSSE